MPQITLTNDTILATRQYYADLALRCIKDAKTGVTRVNDLDKYIAWKMELHDRALSGKSDHTFTFWQHSSCQDDPHLGKRTSLHKLPLDCQRAIVDHYLD